MEVHDLAAYGNHNTHIIDVFLYCKHYLFKDNKY